MNEDPPIVKGGDDARQGTRVKGMVTVLVVSTLVAALAMLVIVIFAMRGDFLPT
jgi:hypothetical protein